jgi:hypothetical protein
MVAKEAKKVGEILIRIGVLINENPLFINRLEEFISSSTLIKNDIPIDFDKINKIDLFQLIREKSEGEVENILSDFSIKELRELLKKYHFGSSSKLKTQSQIKFHIMNQLNQRKTDVFHTTQD